MRIRQIKNTEDRLSPKRRPPTVGRDPRLLQSRRLILKTPPNLKPRMLINRYLAFYSLSHLKCILRTEIVGCCCCCCFLNLCRVRGYVKFQEKCSISFNLPLKHAIWSQDNIKIQNVLLHHIASAILRTSVRVLSRQMWFWDQTRPNVKILISLFLTRWHINFWFLRGGAIY